MFAASLLTKVTIIFIPFTWTIPIVNLECSTSGYSGMYHHNTIIYRSMINHTEHIENIKDIKLKIAPIYWELISIVSKTHTEYSDWLESRRMRDALEDVLFPKR